MSESKLSCPQCQSAEMNSSGKCVVCGYQVQSSHSVSSLGPEAKDGRNFSGMIEMNYSEGAQEPLAKEEIPQWRKDLSQRLQAIKQKREAAGTVGPKAQMENRASPAAGPQIQAVASLATPPARPVEKMPMRKPAPKPSAVIPRQKILQPLELEAITPQPAPKSTDPRDIRKLIDSVVSRQAPPAGNPASAVDDSGAAHERFADNEGKWILLSRTLSGLVDLICIVLGTGIFILAADFSSDIISLNLVDLAALFLLMYFVYSFFFLSTSNQTIGMMITNLRVVGIDERIPSIAQIIIRSCCYLISLSLCGIGLLWSLFNRKSLCLHDRLSNTTIVRV
jgi:uncharacterized RDD family membrane protein YckC